MTRALIPMRCKMDSEIEGTLPGGYIPNMAAQVSN